MSKILIIYLILISSFSVKAQNAEPYCNRESGSQYTNFREQDAALIENPLAVQGITKKSTSCPKHVKVLDVRNFSLVEYFLDDELPKDSAQSCVYSPTERHEDYAAFQIPLPDMKPEPVIRLTCYISK